jgi:lipid-A-disaccharide synthase
MAAENLLIVAGEASGDLHGSRLLVELLARRPDLRAFGLGGQNLAEAGMELLANAEEISAMGLGEVLKVIPRARRIFRQLLAEVDRRGVATAVLIDFPEFNLRLARRLHERGVRVVYYVSPQIWAWRRGRVRQVESWVDRMLVLFPFEEEFYRRHGVEVSTVGHPLVDEVPHLPHVWDRGVPADGRYRICLMPGSRRSEIDHLLPVLLETARLLAGEIDADFVLIRARTVSRSILEPYLSASSVPIEVTSDDRFATAAGCHLAICASGTANLELALVGTPMIVAYRVGPLSYLLGLLILGVRTVSLVNLLLGRRVVPELLQRRATPRRIRDEALRWLRDPPRVEQMRRQLSEVRGQLGDGGASRRAAQKVLAVVEQSQ